MEIGLSALGGTSLVPESVAISSQLLDVHFLSRCPEDVGYQIAESDVGALHANPLFSMEEETGTLDAPVEKLYVWLESSRNVYHCMENVYAD